MHHDDDDDDEDDDDDDDDDDDYDDRELSKARISGHRPLSLKIPNVKFDFDVKFLTLLYPLLKMYVDT